MKDIDEVIDTRTGRPAFVDPRFEVAASRMAEPRPAPGSWPENSAPRAGSSPHRRPLEVENGFPVSDVRTLDDCDVARAILVDAINSIEGQIDAAVTRDRTGCARLDHEWQRKARGALRAKRVAMDEVEIIRRRLVHEAKTDRALAGDRALLDVLKELDPVGFANAVTQAKARGLIA